MYISTFYTTLRKESENSTFYRETHLSFLLPPVSLRVHMLTPVSLTSILIPSSHLYFCFPTGLFSCLSILRSRQSLSYSKIFQDFTEPEGSLSCSQVSATDPILSQKNRVHTTLNYFSNANFNIILPSRSLPS